MRREANRINAAKKKRAGGNTPRDRGAASDLCVCVSFCVTSFSHTSAPSYCTLATTRTSLPIRRSMSQKSAAQAIMTKTETPTVDDLGYAFFSCFDAVEQMPETPTV